MLFRILSLLLSLYYSALFLLSLSLPMASPLSSFSHSRLPVLVRSCASPLSPLLPMLFRSPLSPLWLVRSLPFPLSPLPYHSSLPLSRLPVLVRSYASPLSALSSSPMLVRSLLSRC